MLYRTHHPSSPLFQFHPFLSATTPTSLPPLLHPLLSSKIGNEMECVKGALKTSFRGDFVDTRTFLDEFPAAVGAGANCDDFSVDELLDLSNENGFVEEEEEGEHRVEEEQGPDHEQEDGSGLSLCAKDDFGTAASTAELSVPADDVADLEWLSHFVEDSFSSFSAAFPAGMLPEKPRSQNRPPPETTCSERPCFKTPVPAKARSKRARTGGRVWSLLYPSLSESSSTTSSSSSSTSTTTSCSPPSPWLLCTGGGLIEPVYLEAKPPVKRQKRKPSIPGAGSGQPARRCSHCGVQKTPQWRAGPLGAKTLCNACGVRFKSGRLLPEYRPACSPTFSSELHSNHHRKVLEMRRKKETTVVQPEPALAVPSF